MDNRRRETSTQKSTSHSFFNPNLTEIAASGERLRSRLAIMADKMKKLKDHEADSHPDEAKAQGLSKSG